MTLSLKVAWQDIRVRLFIGLVVLLVCVIALVATESSMIAMLKPKVGTELPEAFAPLVASHQAYMDSQWFYKTLPQTLLVLAPLLGNWRVMSKQQSHELRWLFSLPVPRCHWLMAKAILSGSMLLLMILFSSLVIPLSGHWTGRAYGWGLTCGHVLCAWVGSLPLMAMGLLISLWVRQRMTSVFLSLGMGIAFPVLMQYANRCAPMGFFSLMAGLGLPVLPWWAMGIYVFLTLLGLALANKRVNALEI